jgi:hypothetical protein
MALPLESLTMSGLCHASMVDHAGQVPSVKDFFERSFRAAQ